MSDPFVGQNPVEHLGGNISFTGGASTVFATNFDKQCGGMTCEGPAKLAMGDFNRTTIGYSAPKQEQSVGMGMNMGMKLGQG